MPIQPSADEPGRRIAENGCGAGAADGRSRQAQAGKGGCDGGRHEMGRHLGGVAGATVMPVGNLTDQWFFGSGVDVLAGAETGAVVALGDSLTDGNISTIDAYCRWPDQLARRLAAKGGGRPLAVLNQGLGG